jgi:UPF0176 protein
MTTTTAAPTILNIAAYKFVTLDRLQDRRVEFKKLCTDLDLRGTIMLSPEGINLFVAGEEVAVRHLLTEIRQDPAFEDIEVKESYSAAQPFNRMLVKLKREIIAFGIAEICPEKRTSPKLKATELCKWLSEGRQVRLLDTRNEYEIDLGTFRNAEHLHINHFRDFPAAISQLPEQAKREPLVMFCTGGIRCEKAGPMMERAGFQQVYQLEGGILKYFEECGGAHYDGACFVFDGRVALDPQLKPTGALQCFACQAVITHEDIQSPKFLYGKHCPKCYLTPEQAYVKQLAKRQQQIEHFARPLPGSIPYDNYREIHVPGRLAGLTLIDFLDAWHPQTGRQQWLEWLDLGLISAQGQPVVAERVVREGECFVQHQPDTTEPAVDASIKLLHEDEYLVVVDKPAPLPVHPSGRFNRNTLTHIVGQAYYPEKLRAAHRLDANTTGVVVLCRKYGGSRYVQPQFAQQTVEKVYLARVQGHPVWDSTICEAPISTDPEIHGGRNISEAGQVSVTELRVQSRFSDGTALVEARPRTGRTNQIRIHLWHLGLPIVGDGLYLPGHCYGAAQTLTVSDAPMCLHAWKLTIRHPSSTQPVTYEAALPNWAKV